jgi:hypothetical protein
MGLRDDDWFGHSLVEGASLIGATVDQVREDPVLNIRAGAAFLARIAEGDRSKGAAVNERLETWKKVVEKYSGIHTPDLAESFAFEVFRVIHDGHKRFGIEIDPHPTLDMNIFSERIRRLSVPEKKESAELPTIVALASGYPGAIWMGPAATGNYAAGRSGTAISLVIIHTTEGSAQSALDWFKNSSSGVSAHYIIKGDGGIWQVVYDEDTAYTAGNLSYNRMGVNIELEGWADGADFSWQTVQQNSSLRSLVGWLVGQYPNLLLDRAHMIGHNQVPGVSSGSCAGPSYWGGCSNHHDPGAWWSWRRFMTDLGHTPNYSVLSVLASCSLVALPQSGAPYITSVWPGQRFVSYDSYGGYYLMFLSGREAAQLYLGAGEYHWDAWLPSSCVTTTTGVTQLEVFGAFPDRLMIRDGTLSTSTILAKTIDAKRYASTGATQTGFDGYTWYNFDIAWDTASRTGWSSGAYLNVIGGETLSVSLTANPSSGYAPLSTNLTADVSGTASAPTINYTFWWNCSDSGKAVDAVTLICGDPHNSAIGAKFDGVTDDPKVVNHVYSDPGGYTAKVIAERGTAAPAESRVGITVSSPPPPTVSITIATSPSGLGMTADGASYTAPQTFIWTPGSSHTIGVSSPQTGGSGVQYVFSSWSDGGAQTHSITVPSSNTTYTASFSTQYLLTTAVNPSGAGSVNPNCSGGGCWYNSGATVSLQATPNSGYIFSSWTGTVGSSANPLNLTMDGPKSETANFTIVVLKKRRGQLISE